MKPGDLVAVVSKEKHVALWSHDDITAKVSAQLLPGTILLVIAEDRVPWTTVHTDRTQLLVVSSGGLLGYIMTECAVPCGDP